MENRLFRRYGWAIYLLIFMIGIIAVLLSVYKYKEGTSNTFLLSIGTNLIATSVIFLLVDQFFQWNPRIVEQERLEGQLKRLERISTAFSERHQDFERSLYKMDQDLRKVYGGDVEVFVRRDLLYGAGINALQDGSWNRIRVFAPVGIWKHDTEKEKWLAKLRTAVCEVGPNTKRVKSVWGVFGLPPIMAHAQVRELDHIRSDLEHTYSTLEIFKDLHNVHFHYYPPLPASVGIGAIIFENLDRNDGLVVFGLTSRDEEDVVDVGFVVRNNELFIAARDWFDEKIWQRATNDYILQDDIPIDQRWPGIIDTWYGEQQYHPEEDSARKTG